MHVHIKNKHSLEDITEINHVIIFKANREIICEKPTILRVSLTFVQSLMFP